MVRVMIAIGIECATACGSCRAQVPVNALVPSLYCPSCAAVVHLSPQGIAELVKEALSRPAALGQNEGRRSAVWTPDGQFDVGYLRMEARCEYCGTPVAADQAVRDGKSPGWVRCAKCGAGLSVRSAPADLVPALPGVSWLFGEDFAQLAAAGATALASSQQPQAIPCSRCGAALTVDGSSRQVLCNYCGVTMMLPDEIWARLHPSASVRRWFALVADAPAAAVGTAAVHATDSSSWPNPSDVCADGSGTIYCVGYQDVFAIDARQMQVRWMQHGHGLKVPKIALTLDGRVIVWSNDSDAANVYRANDGQPWGQLGGMEPPGAQMHSLDFFKMSCFACDADGTFLGLFEERLVRFDPQGNGVPTWPEQKGGFSFLKKKPKPAPLWQPCAARPTDTRDKNHWDAPRQRLAVGARRASGFDWMGFKLEKVGNQPIAFGWNCHPRISVGYDGGLYVLGKADTGRDQVLARFDRQGRKIYGVTLPVDDVEWNTRGFAAQDGTAFVLAKQGDYRMLLRVSPDGKTIAPIAQDKAMNGPIIDGDEHLALAPDGTAFVLGRKNSLKVFAPDGRVLGMSPAAQRGET